MFFKRDICIFKYEWVFDVGEEIVFVVYVLSLFFSEEIAFIILEAGGGLEEVGYEIVYRTLLCKYYVVFFFGFVCIV